MPTSNNRIILTDVDGVLLEWENHFIKWMLERNYYNENGLDFGLDEDTIREQYGNTVLKLRHNDVSYPVQVLKLKEHIEEEIDETLTHSCN